MENKTLPFFIFIEGADGTGKTTTSSYLDDILTNRLKKKVAKAFIMQSTQVGTLLRKTAVEEETSEELKFLAFSFGVFYGLEKLLSIHSETDFVIVDRSQASTYAQSICASDAPEHIKTSMINLFTSLNTRFKEQYKGNYLYVHLNASADKALARLYKTRGQFDVLEKRGVSYQEMIKRGYSVFYKQHTNKDEVLHLNTEILNPIQVASAIIKHLKDKEKL